MVSLDPTTRKLVQLESRRFIARCDGQLALVRRADSLREVSRLATISLPYALVEDQNAHEARRLVLTTAEDRARELITEEIAAFAKAEPIIHAKLKRSMMDAWANLTGPLGHLRPWALSRLAQVEDQMLPSGPPENQTPA